MYEQEADAVADKVMRMPDPAASSNFFFKPASHRYSGNAPSAKKRKSECSEKRIVLSPLLQPSKRRII
jgi:hypothetical protein